jgi:hypothetical protein
MLVNRVGDAAALFQAGTMPAINGEIVVCESYTSGSMMNSHFFTSAKTSSPSTKRVHPCFR